MEKKTKESNPGIKELDPEDMNKVSGGCEPVLPGPVTCSCGKCAEYIDTCMGGRIKRYRCPNGHEFNVYE